MAKIIKLHKGFTLAETLITLVVIGVVAALTVPSLIVKHQKEETVIDFTIYSRLETKKFKGKYDLYQNIETGDLVWICPLIEAGDDEDKDKNLPCG